MKIRESTKGLLQGLGTLVGFTILAGAGGVIIAKDMNKRDPIGNARDGYVIVNSGDSNWSLGRKEGWTDDEMYAAGVQRWDPNLKSGEITQVPQKNDNPYDVLGGTGRTVYASREEAEEARGY
jgi:hypothetical protein